MENISLLTYTNSKCSDIQKLYFDSIKLYFPIENHFVLSDNEINESSITLIKYDNNSKYYEQILHSLDKIKTYIEYVLKKEREINIVEKTKDKIKASSKTWYIGSFISEILYTNKIKRIKKLYN